MTIARRASRTPPSAVDVKGLGQVAHGLLSQLEPLLDAVVERIRVRLRRAHGGRTSNVSGH